MTGDFFPLHRRMGTAMALHRGESLSLVAPRTRQVSFPSTASETRHSTVDRGMLIRMPIGASKTRRAL